MKKIRLDLLTAFILLFVFVLFTFALKTVNVANIGQDGTAVGFSSINGYFKDLFGKNETLFKIAEILGYLSIAVMVGFAGLGLYQAIKRKSLLKIDYQLFVLAGLYIAIILAYVLFEVFKVNYRPFDFGEGLEASYPSSHTLMSVVVMCSAVRMFAYLLKDNTTVRRIVSIAALVVAAATVIFRFVSGAHWFTDILGSLILSAALLMLFNSAINIVEDLKAARNK